MKKIVMVLMLGLVLFGLSAGVSLFLNRGDSHHAEDAAAHGGDKGKGLPGAVPSPGAESGARAPVRQSPNPTPENVVALAANLRQQEEALRKREQQLSTRHKNLELVYQDLKTEQKTLDELRQQLNVEMKAIMERMDALERKGADLDKQKQKMSEQAKEIKQTMFEFDNVEQTRIKQMAAMYDSMEPESAAEILHQMADSGKMDTAVKILATMRERQAARILAQLGDRTIAVQFLERLKGLKKPGTAP